MKQLKRMLLINWHYFWNEVVDFETINFLTGKNAAGKSTIIDAMQLVMLGDTSGHFFNKAANEKSSRTLKGYLRGELGDDGDVGFKYLRDGRFTSYLACEFYDDVKNSFFTLGVVFDCYEDGTDEHRFFVLDSGLPENRFVANKVPMSFKELRTFVNKNHKKGRFEFPETNRGYQEILKGKLGGLKNKYFSLFKKAVPFSPITDIETFITEYVCDVKSPVDISLMQDNIRYYKRLEHDADMIERRIAGLEDIAAKYEAWFAERQKLEIQAYLIERAKHQIALDKLAAFSREVDSNREEIAAVSSGQAQCLSLLADLKQKKDELTADMVSSDIYRKKEELEANKKSLEKELDNLKTELKRTVDHMRRYGFEWRQGVKALEGLIGAGEQISAGGIFDGIREDLGRLMDRRPQTLEFAEALVEADLGRMSGLGLGGFKAMRDTVNSFRETASGLRYSLKRINDDAQKRLEDLKKQVSDLEKGIKPYDRKLVELKNAIAEELFRKYQKMIDVHILADLLEIKDIRWSDAIEGYLHSQKFYLIVEPQYFNDALKVYDRLKFDKGFYDWGLVDCGKLSALKPASQKGSLADEVTTDNVYARFFINHVMGRLMKCDSVEELREHERAITDSCMLYQSFVARQLNPDRWRNPYIGRKSIDEQIRTKRLEIVALEENIRLGMSWYEPLKSVSELEVMSANEAESSLQVMQKAQAVPALEVQIRGIVDQIGSLDLTWLSKLQEKIIGLEKETRELEDRERALYKRRVAIETTNELILNEKIPAEKENADRQKQALANRFVDEWVAEKGEPRFIRELGVKQSAEEIYNDFFSQLARTEKQTEKKKDELSAARSKYNGDYKMSWDIFASDNAGYDRELDELRNIKLPEYKKQIQDAKDKAYEQFRDDFLAKLKSNIDTVKNQIDELNAALRESSFGRDRYRFVVNPRTEYRRYYDMITDEMLLEGYNIGSLAFREKHSDAIDELFRQIIDVDSEMNADARAELEKNIKKFTDYRTYLGFDLVVTDEEERNQRLSRTLHKKSGGETQTPFYISVLASFAQLYRIRQKNESGNTMRLIIFDEAFSKMDSERIQESVKLLRRFGLQAVLSAPPEKIGDIAPLVDRNLCVIRDGEVSCVKAFDSRKLMEENVSGL